MDSKSSEYSDRNIISLSALWLEYNEKQRSLTFVIVMGAMHESTKEMIGINLAIFIHRSWFLQTQHAYLLSQYDHNVQQVLAYKGIFIKVDASVNIYLCFNKCWVSLLK